MSHHWGAGGNVRAFGMAPRSKEIQLRNVREGRLVTLTSDLYGSEVEFKGRVVGLSGRTGSAFALVPIGRIRLCSRARGGPSNARPVRIERGRCALTFGEISDGFQAMSARG